MFGVSSKEGMEVSESDISYYKSEKNIGNIYMRNGSHIYALKACMHLQFSCSKESLRSRLLAKYGTSIFFSSRSLVMMSILFLKKDIS